MENRKAKEPKVSSRAIRHAEIVRVSGDLFAKIGFSATTLNDIANAMGILKGSIYHYISSKEDLLFDVIEVAHEGLIENMRRSDRFSSDPLRQLIAFSYGHVALNAVEDRINRGIVYLQDSKHLSLDKLQVVTRQRNDYDAYLRSIISRGRSAGLFDSGLDERMTAFAIFGVLTSHIRWYNPRGTITPAAMGREIAAFVLAAVRQEHTASSRFLLVDEVISEIEAP